MTISRLLGESCAKCGQEFDETGALESVFIGQLQEDEASYVHRNCFQQTLDKHPELKKIKMAKWKDFTENEKDVWRNAFSEVDEDTKYGLLFKKKP